MTVVERDGPCVIERVHRARYVVICVDCQWTAIRRSRRDAEDLFDRHDHGDPSMTDIAPRPFAHADWTEYANCKGMDPDLFFPERGNTGATAQAKIVCAGCTVRAECLKYALDNGEKAGIWGGISAKQRRPLQAAHQRPPRPINHGTHGGWETHYRRGETPCWACREAYRQHQAGERERVKGGAA